MSRRPARAASRSPAHDEASTTSTVPVPASAQAGPVSHTIFRVARLHRMIAGQLLRRVSLYTGQELVMMQLWELGPQRQADLVRLLDSDAATMTRTIKRLEHAGFVRRHACPGDARAAFIEPTAASQALCSEVERIWAELESATVGDLTPDRQAEALRVLRGIEDNLAARACAGDAPAHSEPAAETKEGKDEGEGEGPRRGTRPPADDG